MRRGHKYHAKPTVVDNIRFASKREAARYAELKILERIGEIESLELQPVFPLRTMLSTGTFAGAAQALTGEHPTIGKYIADFRYFRLVPPTGWVVEDCKGFRTPLYKWKKRHVESQYGIQIQEI